MKKWASFLTPSFLIYSLIHQLTKNAWFSFALQVAWAIIAVVAIIKIVKGEKK